MEKTPKTKCFPYLFIYLVSWLHRALVAACSIFAAVRRLFVAAHRLLSSCGTRAPERAVSVVAARGLSCPAACGILVPWPGIEPVSPVMEGRFLTTGPPRKSQKNQGFLSKVCYADLSQCLGH